jgi:hypothetical protein
MSGTDEDEDMSVLKFGKEGMFENDESSCLTVDEVYYLLKSNKAKVGDKWTAEAALNYVERLATTKMDAELLTLCQELSLELKDRELESQDGRAVKLHPFEIACLSNLIKSDDTSYEEALCWITSLNRFTEDSVAKLISIVAERKQRCIEASM